MKKALSILVLFLMGIVIGVTSVEIFLRINPRFGYIYQSFKRLSSKEDVMIEPSNSSQLQPSLLLGYENIPNTNKISSINSFGLVGKTYGLKKDKNTFRMLLLGDSIAWQDWSRQYLEKRLNANPELSSKYKFEIWNTSVPSYDVRRYELYLQNKGLHYKPDMVLIFMFMNDFELNINLYYKDKNNINCAYYSPLQEVSKIYKVNPFLMKHLHIYRFIMLRIETRLSSRQKRKGIDLEEQNGVYYTEKIIEICKKNNLSLLVVIFPYLKPLNEYADYQKHEYKIINSVVKSLVSSYINLYDHIPESDLYNLRDLKQDEIHPSPEGHAVIGEIIYNYLIKNFSFVKNGGV